MIIDKENIAARAEAVIEQKICAYGFAVAIPLCENFEKEIGRKRVNQPRAQRLNIEIGLWQANPITIVNQFNTQPAIGPIGILWRLRELDLDDNQLSGIIPELGYTFLVYFSVQNNQLSGAIPAWLGNNTYLYQLRLGNNQFSGPIPVSLGNLGRLRTLDVDGNPASCMPAALKNWAFYSKAPPCE